MTKAETAAPAANPALFAGGGAYLLWGLLPLFLFTLNHVPAEQIIAHRILWSIPVAGAAALVMGGWRSFRISRGILGALCVSALLIAVNWLIYVWAVGNQKVVEASLGYFINPLLNVALGVFLFRERLSRLQIAALALAAAGVLNQTLAVGAFPWVSLSLAVTFALYGYVRKRAEVPAAVGLFWETALLALPSLGWLVWFATTGGPALGGDVGTFTLLALTGPATAIPLILFAYGARRLNMTTLGVLQYIAPTLQFITGIAFGEPFTPAHAVTFALIWSGLALYTWETVNRARRSAALAA